MGAHNIEHTLKGSNWDNNKLAKWLRTRQDEDRDYNGHQEGYSGDFQTVNEVDNRTHLVFESYNEAHDYCLEHAEKWCTVVAVRYKVAEGAKATAKLKKLDDQIETLQKQLRQLEQQFSEKIDKKLKSQEFITCGGCKSRMDTRFRSRTLKCPICQSSFLPKTDLKKKQTLLDKIEAKQTAHEEERQKILTKAKAKGKVNTLVAGWGAS